MAKPTHQGVIHHQRQVITQQYSGIIPNAEEMERYSHIQPDMPERILKMAESQMAHRIEMEIKHKDLEATAVNASVDSMLKRNTQITRGQWIAFALCAGALVVAYLFLQAGSPSAGATIATGAFVQLAAAFIFAQRGDAETKTKPVPSK